jgi:hypothetical protein
MSSFRSTSPHMLIGTCHCGQVSWTYKDPLESATACNCTSCRRWGALWAYGYEGEGVTMTGRTQAYVRGPNLEYHFCPTCGAMAAWRALQQQGDGQRRMAVNLRLTEPDLVAHLPIDHFEGLVAFEDLPRDGRCVRDLWF